jgi:predicted ATP-grasp superfamily ATP-dependent carboligase
MLNLPDATLSRASSGAAKAFLIFSGSNTRAVVAFCRALAARHLPIVIVARTGEDLILRTRYRRHVAALRTLDRLDFDDLDRCIGEARLKTGAQQFIICPTSEFLDLFLLENRDFFASRGCTLPLVNLDLYRRVSDKHSFSRICQRQGIAIPRAIALETSPKFPFVAKPRYNVTAEKQSLYPHLIFNAEDLAAFQRDQNSDDFYFEEYVAGPSYYLLYYLSRRGEVTAWSQQNLAQQPGGKSIVLARSAQIHRQPIAARFADMLQRLGFWGLAMIEVISQGDDHVFIELNPRFWGPFQLLLNAGSPLLDAFIDDQLDLAADVPPAPAHPQASYLWLGGMAEAWAAGRPLRWHDGAPRRRALFVASRLGSDVYARPDTAALFLHELKLAARSRWARP